MKKIYMIATIAGLAVVSLTFQSSRNGVAETQGKDRTGAPGSEAPCSGCHTGGNFGTMSQLSVIDTESQEVVTEYVPGVTYLVAPTVQGVNNDLAGFQATALLADESNAGEFLNPLPGLQIEDVDGRHIIEHSQPSIAGAWGVDWVAPEQGSGSVTFYMSGNAVNGNDETSGDQYAGAPDVVITEGLPENVNELNAHAQLVEAFVNANGSIVITTDRELIGAEANLYDMQGRFVAKQMLNDPVTTWDVAMSVGTYIVSVEKGALQRSVRVVLR